MVHSGMMGMLFRVSLTAQVDRHPFIHAIGQGKEAMATTADPKGAIIGDEGLEHGRHILCTFRLGNAPWVQCRA